MDYPLLRQLVYERWFRLAFIVFLCIFIGLALFLPKIWRTSKPGFLPIIRVSGLDLVQAWSLQRTAVKATAAGKFEEAHYAWQAALANNRADPDLVRGALHTFLLDPKRRQQVGRALQQSFWLLRLTDTNMVDVELVSRVFEQSRYFDGITTLAEPRVKELSPALAEIYLKALFNQGRMKTFQDRWGQFASVVKDDPEMRLYRAAYLAGWGQVGTITEARQELEAATRDPARRVLAYQLLLGISAHELDASAYGQALKTLEELHEDTLAQHTGYWRLLITNARKAEAVNLAHSYSRPPASVLELTDLAEVYDRLGLQDEALKLMERNTKDFGHASFYWITYANLLIQAKRWEDIRNLALRIRGQEGVRDQLNALSYFLEGRAELALGREGKALPAFQKAAEGDFPNPELGERVAAQLFQADQPQLARQVLAKLENAREDDPEYWLLCFAVADRLRDVDLLVKAGRRGYELAPRNVTAINNYAAALLIRRENPEQAIKLTLELYSQNPDSLHAVVNHSAALLMNDRPKEAEALLMRVNRAKLTPAQLALYNLDLFETYCGLREYDKASALAPQVQTNLLYPPQQQWFDKMRRQLPVKKGEKAAAG